MEWPGAKCQRALGFSLEHPHLVSCSLDGKPWDVNPASLGQAAGPGSSQDHVLPAVAPSAKPLLVAAQQVKGSSAWRPVKCSQEACLVHLGAFWWQPSLALQLFPTQHTFEFVRSPLPRACDPAASLVDGRMGWLSGFCKCHFYVFWKIVTLSFGTSDFKEALLEAQL